MTSDRSTPFAAKEDPLLRLLRAWRLPLPNPALAERIVASAVAWPQEHPYRPPYRLRSSRSFGWWAPRLASLAAGVAIGIIVGFSEPLADDMASGLYSSLFDQPGTTLLALDTSELVP